VVVAVGVQGVLVLLPLQLAAALGLMEVSVLLLRQAARVVQRGVQGMVGPVTRGLTGVLVAAVVVVVMAVLLEGLAVLVLLGQNFR
jgi:hypothetical protein